MMKRKAVWGLILLLGSLVSCSQRESTEFGIAKNMIVSGTITNYDKSTDPKTLQILRRDLFESEERLVASINADGTFQFEFPVAYTEEVYLFYNTLITLLVVPGDSLSMQIDKGVGSTKKLIDFVRYSDNPIGETNHYILKFLSDLPNEHYIYELADAAEKNLSPEAFTQYIKSREQVYRAFLSKFKKENPLPDLFSRWVENYIHYGSLHDLMRYRWTHPHYNQMARDSFSLPEKYFSFLKRYKMNDNALFTFNHIGFLHELSMYLHEVKLQQPIVVDSAHQTNAIALFYNRRIESIDSATSGFTRDVMMAKLYLLTLKGRDLDRFTSIYDSAFTQQPYFLDAVNREAQKLSDYLSNQNIGAIQLATISHEALEGFMDTLAIKYKNKVIYVDFWAPWCGPCMKEMPAAKALQNHFANQDVVFLYLACKCTEASWRSTIANEKLSGQHYLLTDDQFNILSALFEFNGIPHYSLIDKKGNIVLKQAPRPSAGNQAQTEIERLLLQ